MPLNPATPEAPRQTVPDPALAILPAACHGPFAPEGDPLQSSLLLANGSELSLADLYAASSDADGLPIRFHFAQSLATLSACEAAIGTDFSLSGEYHGLPAGMLFAGATAVVAPLWRVDDLATTILMRRFYAALLSPAAAGVRPSVAGAPGQARRALRDLTAADLPAEGWLDAARIAAMAEER